MKIIAKLSQFFVGILFIISGLIKLNDPVGFSFKLEEYFSAGVLDLPSLYPYALDIALIVVIAEVLLGVALLIGFMRKLTLWLLLAMIVFFSFLTFYSAYFNKVTDCGCFGDAISLTPWQSFTKDIVLLILILFVFFNEKVVSKLFTAKKRFLIMLVSLLGCGFMGYWVLNHLPLKDFRVYKVGTDILENMEVPEDAPLSKFEMTFYYLVDGKETAFSDKELSQIPSGATFIRRTDKLIQQGYIPPIHDFTMDKDGFDYTYDMMQEQKLALIITYDLQRAEKQGMQKMKDFANKAIVNGYKVIGLTASDSELSDQNIELYDLPFEYYTCDGTTLKTIERSNPSIVLLEKGVITQKSHYNDIDQLNL
ncbi:BT_3928 family protein [Myroides sp. LJL115]